MPRLGAIPVGGGRVEFCLWAPHASTVHVRLADGDHALEPDADGFHGGTIEAEPGDDYRFVLDGGDAWPDPCSRAQPDGVRGPSRVVDTHAFEIAPGPRVPLDQLVVYELHAG